MHFSTALLPLTLFVSYVAAQTTAAAIGSSSSTCEGQNVLEACLSSTTAIANACQSTDYGCLCTSWDAVLTCFNECPNDARYSSTLSSKQTYCNDASVYTSTSTSAISRDPSTSAEITAAAATGTGTGTGTGTETQTQTQTGAAKSASASAGSKVATATGSAASAASTDKNSGAGRRVWGGMMGVLGGVGLVAAVFL
ncbi:hypothetical protein SBOR_2197 [Sclerotinia borealis F-4128]|uniref:GPI anchored serine-threonine rich protein n=1 Tax=Sclerotinia borealis (strain F-4128) TaxID=1432307 RepID=W9CS64_SCLBF|nr:hypothetical protein SBOR_2197 [Sclerotinia borealis F-4128]